MTKNGLKIFIIGALSSGLLSNSVHAQKGALYAKHLKQERASKTPLGKIVEELSSLMKERSDNLDFCEDEGRYLAVLTVEEAYFAATKNDMVGYETYDYDDPRWEYYEPESSSDFFEALSGDPISILNLGSHGFRGIKFEKDYIKFSPNGTFQKPYDEQSYNKVSFKNKGITFHPNALITSTGCKIAPPPEKGVKVVRKVFENYRKSFEMSSGWIYLNYQNGNATLESDFNSPMSWNAIGTPVDLFMRATLPISKPLTYLLAGTIFTNNGYLYGFFDDRWVLIQIDFFSAKKKQFSYGKVFGSSGFDHHLKN